ncbi:MAG: hypothetical protein ACREJC_01430, partial [Tepidisphaeraceae bacterium]
AHDADKKVQADVERGRELTAQATPDTDAQARKLLESAAGNSSASPLSRAQAKAMLAQSHVDAASLTLREIDRGELELARAAFDLSQLASQVNSSAQMVADYRKFDPTGIRAQIQEKVVEAQGGPDKPAWFTHGNSVIPTLSAVKLQVSQTEGEIAKLQDQLAALDTQRNELLKQIEDANQTDPAQQSVDEYKRTQDLRKQAELLFIEIDRAQTALVPLQKQLGVAQGQEAALNNVIRQLQEQSASLEAGWKAMQEQMDAQIRLARVIVVGTGAPESSAGAGQANSIAEKATLIARMVDDIRAKRLVAQSDLADAAKLFDDAASAATDLRRELKVRYDDEANRKRPERVAWQGLMELTHPQLYKVRAAAARRAQGGLFASEASSLATRVSLQQLVAPIAERIGATLPPSLSDASLEKAEREALAQADEAYKLADETLRNVTDGEAPEEAKQYAYVERILTMYGWSQVARLAGDNAQADAKLQDAMQARAAAVESGAKLPVLPSELTPPPPPPPAPAPTTEPTTAPAAPAPEAATPATDPSQP